MGHWVLEKSPSLPTGLDLLHLCQFQKTEWALRPLEAVYPLPADPCFLGVSQNVN